MSYSPPDKFKVFRACWKGIEALGLSLPTVLRHAGLPATLHLDDSRFVTTADFFALWRSVEILAANPRAVFQTLGITRGADLPPSSLIAHYAKDYRDGLLRLARFKPLLVPMRLELTEGGDECIIASQWIHARETEPRLLTDLVFASLIELGRCGTGQRLTPRRVELTGYDDGRGAYESYYGCPIAFHSDRNALILTTADLALPFVTYNPDLLEVLSPVLAAGLAKIEEPASTSDQVKAVLKQSLPSGRPELSDIASELGLSERTLQRRMTSEGTHFRQLLLETRQELGRQLLLERPADINEVAYLLGFEDANSFYRAFRSWEGTTPTRWRALQS